MIYWDTSAIITFLAQGRLSEILGATRAHTLAEFYARTTGKGFIVAGRTVKLAPELAARRVADLVAKLTFVDLTAEEAARALSEAAISGVHGGRTHDFLHFAAARKVNAEAIYTFNDRDFPYSTIPVTHPPPPAPHSP